MSQIEFKNVKKNYGDVNVIHEFNMEIEKGEFVVFVGPSGCGKSTLLRSFAGLETITAGECIVDGVVVNDLEPKARQTAFVFQDYALYPHLTVEQNLSFALENLKVGKADIKRRVDESADLLHLTPLMARYPRELSGGQQQRVALGRAIVRRPNIFLMDEPLSNLDAKLRFEMRRQIKKIQKNFGITTMYVTHDQEEAMAMGDRIVVLDKGIAQQIGTPYELFKNPVNKFVAGFIGIPAMAFMNVDVKEKDGGIYLNADNIQVKIKQAENSAKLKSYIGKTVSLGVRSDSVELSGDGKGSGEVTGDIDLIEIMGAESLVFISTCADNSFSVRIDTDSALQLDKRIALNIIEDKIHLFDSDTELCIF